MPNLFSSEGTLLAFDFGLKRLGIATGDTRFGLAHPHSTLVMNPETPIPLELFKLVKEWKPIGFILGIPFHLDDRTTPHPLQAPCIAFGQLLSSSFSLPVALVNEQLSSYAAEEYYRHHHQKSSSQRNKKVLDACAAQCILQDFFNGSTPHDWILPAKS